jgi:hypothetical protein
MAEAKVADFGEVECASGHTVPKGTIMVCVNTGTKPNMRLFYCQQHARELGFWSDEWDIGRES